MRKTARPVVWEGGGAQSPSLDPNRPRPPADGLPVGWLHTMAHAPNDIDIPISSRDGQGEEPGAKKAFKKERWLLGYAVPWRPPRAKLPRPPRMFFSV
jgi:hypothetical protein